MANLHLVTGYAGSSHIKAEDHGSLYAALTNGGSYVLNRGNKLSASAITSNTVRVLDGDLLLQGRHVRLSENTYVDLAISSGAQGMNRNDLIVARYTKNSSSGVEECNLVVIKGTATSGNASDPSYSSGDLLNNRLAQVDFPLYRVKLSGLSVSLVKLFEVITFVTVGDNGKINTSYLPAMNYIPTSQKAAAGGVASLDSSGKVPSGQLPSMDYIPTNQKGSANGVASLNSSGQVPSSQLPSLDYIPNNQKGAASGVATLDASGGLNQWFSETVETLNATDQSSQKIGSVTWTRFGKLAIGSVEVQSSGAGGEYLNVYAKLPQNYAGNVITTMVAAVNSASCTEADVACAAVEVYEVSLGSAANRVIFVKLFNYEGSAWQGKNVSLRLTILLILE